MRRLDLKPPPSNSPEGIELERMRKNMKRAVAAICLCFLISCSAFAASSREDLQARVDSAKNVLDQILNAQDHSIPLNILEQATCVGVVPGLIKGAFVFGGQ